MKDRAAAIGDEPGTREGQRVVAVILAKSPSAMMTKMTKMERAGGRSR